MSNEYYLDMFADSIEDEEYIKDYQKNFAEDVKKILENGNNDDITEVK